MRKARRTYPFHPIMLLLMLLSGVSWSQCPEVFDFYGNVVDNPYWYSCTGNNFTFNLQSPDDWGDYTIDWGDGSSGNSGASWTSPATIQHIYTAAVDTFIVTITEINTGCVVEGVVVMEESTSASIQIPIGGLTQACAPQVLEFINSSTNVSETTVFTWDFGDGSPQLVFDYTNWGQTVAHLYEIGTVDCETEVSLSAENYCNIIQGGPSEATFSPIRIWDLDEAAITPSATILCYPDTIVDLTNTTQRNCLFQGNIYQRYEYWNFGDYWGLGYDSIVDWTPWPPTFPYTMAYPGIGTYEVTLLDSNFCGIDTTTIQIKIVAPPTAGITASADTICIGEPITFTQNATGGANSFQWNFDDGIGWLPTGGGNITYVYNNPGTYNVCSAVSISSSSGACADTACVPVVVLASPIAQIQADNLTGCDAITVDFDDASTGATSWQWTFDVSPFSYTGINPPLIDYNSPGNYVVSLTVEGLNGCLDSDQEVISVYQSPVPDMLADNVCQDEEGLFLDLSTSDPGDPILQWNWNFGDNSSSSLQNPSHTYASIGDYDVTLTVTTATCSASQVFQVSVEPAPIPNISLSPDNGCSPLSVSFVNNSTGADSYTWNFGDGSGSPDIEPTHVFNNFTQIDTTYIIVFTANTTFGCSQNDTLEVTVEPGALASFTDNSLPPSCAPFDAQFTNTSIGATSYQWDFGDGSPTSAATNPTHTYNNTTGFLQSYPVTLIAYSANGCNDTIVSNITVYPVADFNFDVWPDSGCSPLIVTMPFVQGINVYSWNFGDGSPISSFPTPTHVYVNATNDPLIYDITLIGISPFGCTDTTTSQVLITPQPTAQFTIDDNSGCSPLIVEFENLSIQADTYMWVYSDGDTSYTQAPIHTHTFTNLSQNIVEYTVQMTAYSDDGCDDTFIQSLEVYPEVQAAFDDPGPGCSPYSVTFENSTLNGDDFNWEFGNGFQSINEYPTTIFVNNGVMDTTYSICLSVSSVYGCQDDYCADLIIHPTPISDFDLSEDAACNPAPVDLTNQSSLATNYEWIYGDGNNSFTDDLVHTYIFESQASTPLEYEILLVAINDAGCSDTSSTPFTIYPPVVAALSSDTAGCSPLTAFFSNQSIGASAGFDWDFGDGLGTSQANPSHIFVNNSGADTTFNVMLIASSIYGCVDTTYQPIHVFATPIANIAIDTTLGCYPLEVVFENLTTGADSYTWVYGTGQVSDTSAILHTYTYYNFGSQPVTYDVTLIATTDQGCTSSDQLSVDVLPVLEADFNVPDEGCSPFTTNFSNQSTGALSYQWEFGDGDTHTIANPSHTYYNNGTEDIVFNAMLIAQSYYGCFDTTYAAITVFATPFADFDATPESQVFPDATIDLTNNSVAGTVSYSWDMDDGEELNGINPGTYTYDTWGVYDIELIVTNGFCSDTAWKSVEIIPPPPSVDFDVDTAGCAPLTIHFQSNSMYAAAYQWTFGDGGSSGVENPVYTYYQPGTYNVTLTVTGFDGFQTDSHVIEQAVTVYPVAIAAFTITPNEVSIPGQPIYTINLSQNATQYEWDFGDGSTSNDVNPLHYYQTEGYYDISLVAFNEWNCPDTFLIVDVVHAIAAGELDFPNAFTPNTVSSSGGVYDPTSFNNDIFFPIHYGVVDYQLQVFNKWGELLYESFDVNMGWDGYYHDQLCKEDVYAWKAKASFSNGQEIIRAGDVTLLRK
jgi:PKD repeat protein